MSERKQYTSDLTDHEWGRIEPLLPDEKPVGRNREVELRDLVDAIFYRVNKAIAIVNSHLQTHSQSATKILS